ncbi:MAG: ferric reductase-like transmembrane domain-containing protein [Solirubrobacteraceae bacterium]
MSPSLAATLGPSAYWYLTRASGAVALVLLTISVVLGIVGSMRVYTDRWPRFAVDTIHRDVSLLVIVVLVIHIITSVLDGFAPISLVAAVIPFDTAYRPLWLGFGALAFDLLLALVITSLVRRRLGYRTWRAVHWLAYASWPIAVLHGLGTGSDTKALWMLLLTALCVAAVAAAICWRVAGAERPVPGLQGPAILLSLALVAALAVFTVAGPLQSGWARRAGTPANLLAPKSAAHVVVTRVSSSSSSYVPKPFSAALAGSVKEAQLPIGSIVDLSMGLHGGSSGRLRVRLAGAPINGGGLSLTGSQVDLIASGVPTVLQGQINSLEGEHFTARVDGSAGTSFTLHVRLHIDTQTDAVTGTLQAQPGGVH